ncbi:ComEC/Rec2 family competence protein [Qipengyuania thermophila]|uniref:ComEC/Rec2 family competence protein n=1 Tax=Qipengyuania thermophila TaxID=2509361 RepID=UPI001F2CFAD0|nr:ComEC/Rec2 family competence protein [Qipengyuania thermophila]
MSRCADAVDDFLLRQDTARGPWLVLMVAAGIAAWFLLPDRAAWLLWCAALAGGAGAAWLHWRGRENRRALLLAGVSAPLLCAAGTGLMWLRSEVVGAAPIGAPQVGIYAASVLTREEQPAQQRVRLTLATRDARDGRLIKVRLNVPEAMDQPLLREGARVTVRARLMPPAEPMLPGAYDFARAAWFAGLAATGTALEIMEVQPPPVRQARRLAETQRALSAHVRSRVEGSSGAIAAAFASGDRGSIAAADDEAMRDAGLTHLLSISGLHVSATIAAAYFVIARVLAAVPPLALRIRVPLVAAFGGAVSGVGYTLLTGAEVPTVRSCLAALLVLVALILGRQALSMRMVAMAAAVVMVLWPEQVVTPSFQMSFAAVIAIVALHGSAPARAWLAPRAEPLHHRAGRNMVALFTTGLVIELALMPIVLFHFQRAGLYGALANVVAIPLVTFCAMPFIALSLLLDVAGLGGVTWPLVQWSLDTLLGLAHFTAAQPGAARLHPHMGVGVALTFAAGLAWLALWQGKVRLFGLLPVALAATATVMMSPPDLVVTGDGRHVAVRSDTGELLTLRNTRSDYVAEHLTRLAAVDGTMSSLTQWPGARCNADFCAAELRRDGRVWTMLLARSDHRVDADALAAACGAADIVVAPRRLPRSCQARWLTIDRRMLERTGGVAVHLAQKRIVQVRTPGAAHGWSAPPSAQGQL